jgi:hypothetical protein
MWGTTRSEVDYKRYAPELTVHRTFLATKPQTKNKV